MKKSKEPKVSVEHHQWTKIQIMGLSEEERERKKEYLNNN